MDLTLTVLCGDKQSQGISGTRTADGSGWHEEIAYSALSCVVAC